MKEEDATEMLTKEIKHSDNWKIVRSICTTGMKKVLKTLVKMNDHLLNLVGEDGATPLMW